VQEIANSPEKQKDRELLSGHSGLKEIYGYERAKAWDAECSWLHCIVQCSVVSEEHVGGFGYEGDERVSELKEQQWRAR
jgi:hypothetical protein